MATTLTARTPEDLIAVVPVVLGFEPADSIVMLTVGARRTFHARVDLPSEPDDLSETLELLLAPAARHRAQAVVFLLYTADEQLGLTVARQLRRRLTRGRPRLVDVLRVDGGRWYPALRRREAPHGVPFDVSSHPFLAAAVFEGRVVQRSRADLAATLRPDRTSVAEVEAALTGRAQSAGWVADLLDRCVAAGASPTTVETARLLESIAVPAVRDVAWERIRRVTARDDVRFWSDLVRKAPEELVAHAAAVLAFAAWIAGDGALAWCAVDRAREVEPRHSLAALVADMLSAAIAPSQWEEARRSFRSVS